MTMREKLESAGFAAIANLPVVDALEPGSELDTLRRREAVRALLDAILTTLRKPDDGMIDAGMFKRAENYRTDEVFTAMIDHIRSGK